MHPKACAFPILIGCSIRKRGTAQDIVSQAQTVQIISAELPFDVRTGVLRGVRGGRRVFVGVGNAGIVPAAPEVFIEVEEHADVVKILRR